MLRSRLFWKLLLTFVGLTLMSAIALAVLTYQWERKLLEQRARQQLQHTTDFVLPQISQALADSESDDEISELATRISQVAGLRITIIDSSGGVLAESAETDKLAENQALRPEFVAAMADGKRFETRQSRLLSEPMIYFAKRLGTDEEPTAVVRAGFPVSRIAERLSVFGSVLIGMVGVIAVVSALVTYAVVRHLVKPVLTLNDAAKAIGRGEYQQRVFVPGNDELAALARSFNHMSYDLGHRLTELRASDQRQATVLGGMIEGVVAVDSRQRILFANAAAGRLFDFAPAAVRGRPLLEVVRQHDIHNAMQQTLAERRPLNLDILWDVGGQRDLAVQMNPLPGDPCPGAVIVMHDNTQLKRLETIRSEFVANVSHELKTPLSAIKAYCETLLGGAIDDLENRERFLQQIDEQSDRLNDLIQDMLRLARIESEQQHFEMEPLDIRKTVEACLSDQRERATAKRIDIDLCDAPPLLVVADEEGMRVIVGNLIDNAVKYTPEGGRVSIAWESDEDGAIKISVADNGPGIPNADLPRIFERFYRVDKARSRELGSTGLGLSIVKHLAQSFHGTAGVESKLGEGSIFWVKLPAGERAAA